MPSVIPTVRVPQGAHFVREWGPPPKKKATRYRMNRKKRGEDVAAPTPFRFPAGHRSRYSSGFLCSSFRRTQRRSTSAWNRSSTGLQSGLSMCFVFPMCFSHSLTGTFFPFSSGS